MVWSLPAPSPNGIKIFKASPLSPLDYLETPLFSVFNAALVSRLHSQANFEPLRMRPTVHHLQQQTVRPRGPTLHCECSVPLTFLT